LQQALFDVEKLIGSKWTEFHAGREGLQTHCACAIHAYLHMVVNNGQSGMDALARAAEAQCFSAKWGSCLIRQWVHHWLFFFFFFNSTIYYTVLERSPCLTMYKARNNYVNYRLSTKRYNVRKRYTRSRTRLSRGSLLREKYLQECCDYTFMMLKENMPDALASVSVTLIRKWQNWMFHWVDAYHSGLDTQEAQHPFFPTHHHHRLWSWSCS
ncbi:hypothetical protein AN958_11537, partial [Leucoagaricus sp. SymC.cos]